MLITKKMLLALTLVGALLGAGIGALITHSASASSAASNRAETEASNSNPSNVNYKSPETLAASKSSEFNTPEEQAAYKEGFENGYSSCGNLPNNGSQRLTSSGTASTRYTRSRRVYYDYGTSHGRTFWQKHRDKLTLAIGTGAGAIVGGLIGGKRGAGIGSLAGLGSSALYTYKIRKRSRRY